MSLEKLSLKKINQILTSEPSKLFNFDASDKQKKEWTQIRKTGDKWTDDNGSVWEQHDGFKTKVSAEHETMQSVRDYLAVPDLCPVCNSSIKQYQDKKFYKVNKMCMKCTIAFEHELKLNGTYKEYEKKRIKENAIAWLKDAEAEIEILKDTFKTEYVNEDGSIEKWEYTISPEQLKKNIETQFQKFKEEFLKKLES